MAEEKKRRIVFMGTPEFGAYVLKKILATPAVEVAGVFTQPDRKSGRGLKLAASPVKETALACDIPVLQPAKLDAEAVSELRNLRPDLIVVASYGLLLPEKVLAIAPCLNVHASLLPAWRGAAPVQAALRESWKTDARTGISIMKMEKGLDTGPVYCMAATPTAGKNSGELALELAELGGDAICGVISSFELLEPVPQDDKTATYAAKLSRKDGRIDWRQPPEVIEAHIRAMNPWPGATCVLEVAGEPLEVTILAAEVMTFPREPQSGQVIAQGGKMAIACEGGWLSPLRLKPAGRKAMDAASFINGYLAGRTARLRMEHEE